MMANLEDETLTHGHRHIIYHSAWFNKGHNSSYAIDKLVRFLGHASINDMLLNYTEEDARKVRLLGGPYGETIYKMMLINGVLVDEDD